jgi:hypothetical protein
LDRQNNPLRVRIVREQEGKQSSSDLLRLAKNPPPRTALSDLNQIPVGGVSLYLEQPPLVAVKMGYAGEPMDRRC